MSKILLSADSTCDLGSSLKEAFQVHYYPFHIILDGRDYQDNVDITPQEIFQTYYDRKFFPGRRPLTCRSIWIISGPLWTRAMKWFI